MTAPAYPSNRELARMAVTKAKKHLETAETLHANGEDAFAYGHLVFALEETGKGAVRLLIDLGVWHWGDVIEGVRLEERDLTSGGSHKVKTYVGGALALAGAIREVLVGDRDELLAAIKGQGANTLSQMAEVAAERLFPKVPKMVTSDYFPSLDSAQVKREAAFYSGPKKPGAPIPTEPTSKDYDELRLPVRGAIEGVVFLDRPPDPRVVDFVAEFVPRFVSELKRHGKGAPS